MSRLFKSSIRELRRPAKALQKGKSKQLPKPFPNTENEKKISSSSSSRSSIPTVLYNIVDVYKNFSGTQLCGF